MSEHDSIETPEVSSARDFVKELLSGRTSNAKSSRMDGRRCALAAIDLMLADERNLHRLYEAAEEQFDADPVEFMRSIVFPMSQRILREDDDGNVEPESIVQIVLPDNGR